jgi:hypothetical protein
MEDKSSYKIQLTGPGLSLERELSEDQAHSVLMWLISGEPLSAVSLAKAPLRREFTAERTPTITARLSVREFMQEYDPVRIPDKIACFALFLRDQRDMKEFTKNDLVAIFQEAAEPLPMNLARDIQTAKQLAWIAPIPNSTPLAFYLTHKGEAAVGQKFPKELRRALTTRRRRATVLNDPDENDSSPRADPPPQ